MSKYQSLMKDMIGKTRVTDRFVMSSPSKISKKSHCAFSLPAGPDFSCPGATEACKECYAMKHRHLWPAVQDAFARNWKLIQSFEKKNDVFSAVIMLSGSISDSNIFRIHESGDFYSQWYVDVWDRVIKTRKDVSFWAYTRSFDLNYGKILKNKNFMLWASADKYNLNEAEKMANRYKAVRLAYGPINKIEDAPENSFVCPVTSKKINVEGACEKCKFCITRDAARKNVTFIKH